MLDPCPLRDTRAREAASMTQAWWGSDKESGSQTRGERRGNISCYPQGWLQEAGLEHIDLKEVPF